MTGGRKSITEQARARLLDQWSGEPEFGAPRGCVTTSFTFDAELFEEQCLKAFLSIQAIQTKRQGPTSWNGKKSYPNVPPGLLSTVHT